MGTAAPDSACSPVFRRKMIASGTDQRKSAGGISFTLHPFFLPEPDEAEHHDEDGDYQDRRIAPAPFQLRHVAEVHAVPPGDQGQGQEDGHPSQPVEGILNPFPPS